MATTGPNGLLDSIPPSPPMKIGGIFLSPAYTGQKGKVRSVVFAVLGTDARQEYLKNSLQEAGHRIAPHSMAQVVILPMPALDATGKIRGTAVSPAQVADEISPHALVLGGKMDALRGLFPRCEDYALWESLARKNARPTAEGAIQLAMEAMPSVIEGSRFLVIGAGRIGTVLAQKLMALGADVTLSARKDADFLRLQEMGIPSDTTGVYQKGLLYDCIINTVPCPVLSRGQIAQTPTHCLMMELASAPYGFSQEDCASLGRKYLLGQALPAKCAPKTAGEILAEEILAFLAPMMEGETP